MCGSPLARKPEGTMKMKARSPCLGESCPWQRIIDRSHLLPRGVRNRLRRKPYLGHMQVQ